MIQHYTGTFEFLSAFIAAVVFLLTDFHKVFYKGLDWTRIENGHLVLISYIDKQLFVCTKFHKS